MKNNAHRFIAGLFGLLTGSNKAPEMAHQKRMNMLERIQYHRKQNPWPVRQRPRRRHNGPGQHKHYRASARYRYQNGLGEFAMLNNEERLALRREMGI